VVATGGAYVTPNVFDATVTQLLFDNGARAHIHVSWLHPFKEQRLVVVGSKRMAVLDDVTKELLLYDQRVEADRDGAPTPVKADPTHVDFSDAEPLRLQMQAFLQAIETRQAPLTGGESALRVLRVLEAAERSLVSGGAPIVLPLES
jgi:predicted dehydrogenase